MEENVNMQEKDIKKHTYFNFPFPFTIVICVGDSRHFDRNFVI